MPDNLRTPEDRLRLAQEAGGIAAFEADLVSGEWAWTPQIALLFGFDPDGRKLLPADWERCVFVDDVLKLRGALDAALQNGTYYVEFRIRPPEQRLRWISGKG